MREDYAQPGRRWSSYNYVEDNPIRFIDPDGMITDEGGSEDDNKGKSRLHAGVVGRYYAGKAGGSSGGSGSSGPPDWFADTKTGQPVYRAGEGEDKTRKGEVYLGKDYVYDHGGVTYYLAPDGNWSALGMWHDNNYNASWHADPSAKYLGQLGDGIAFAYTLIVGGGLGSIASAGATLAAQGSEAVSEGTTVFRAVDAAEAESINSTGQFLVNEGGTEGKYFAQSLEDAHWYGSKLYPEGYSIVRGSVQEPIGEFWHPNVDIGAYFFPSNFLPNITPIP